MLFGQYVRVLRQTGHTEKATALLQATTELNLFCPDVLRSASRADKLQFLESFWDSAAPRSGETGALGFDTWIERKGNVPFCSMYSQGETRGGGGGAESLLFEDNGSMCYRCLWIQNHLSDPKLLSSCVSGKGSVSGFQKEFVI